MNGSPLSGRISTDIVSLPSGLVHKVGDASQDFESVLLGQWLQQADASFGSVPGEEDENSNDSQMKNFAMQHLAQEITKSGGIGIAKMVERALTKPAGLSGTAGDATTQSEKNINVTQSMTPEIGRRSVSEDSYGK